MSIFKKKEKKTYDKATKKPVIKCSICTGEQVAGFVDIHTGKFEDIMLLRNEKDLERFVSAYSITGAIEKIY